MVILWWGLGAVALSLILLMIQAAYLASVLRREDAAAVGLNYYGLPLAQRNAFKERLRRQARLLSPILWLNGNALKVDFRRQRVRYKGISGPAGTCSAESFARAESYVPQPEDVFVVTPMRCGTTWMQHVVFQVLHRGRGDLVETGRALYAVSPWLEGRKSVPVEDEPLLGRERPTRLIKTHLPASLCPFRPEARYLYVTRHPVACLASCIDFIRTNAGSMTPSFAAFEEWYTTPDLMWWGTWTDHVKGWWETAQKQDNVRFVLFEDMKKDLASVVRQVADFLGVRPLSDDELADVLHKCGFAYMQEHQEAFEMLPPHILQVNAELFVSGSAERHKDVPEEAGTRVAQWVAKEMAGCDFPLAERYPDVVQAGTAPPAP